MEPEPEYAMSDLSSFPVQWVTIRDHDTEDAVVVTLGLEGGLDSTVTTTFYYGGGEHALLTAPPGGRR